MQTLTRQILLEHLRAARATPGGIRQLPAWAFDQFYAVEEGKLELEQGYRGIISRTLDNLMFGDEAAFALTTDDVDQLIRKLEVATPQDHDEPDDDE